MNVKIDLVISASPELLAALQLLTRGKAVATPAPVVSIAPENGEVKRTKAKKTETVAAGVDTTTVQDKAVDFAVAQQLETTKELLKTKETKTDLTQEMIIADAVPKSKAGHKDKIKAKVTELGYESITDLQPEHFNEFYAFLQTIPKP